MLKYGFDDARDVLERASARETAARVAAGTLAKLLLGQIGIAVVSHVVQLGPEAAVGAAAPTIADLARVDASPVRCFDPEAEARMVAAVKAAAKDGDSLGGVVEVLAYGVPVGLGSHVHWDRRLDALLAQALMSIQAVKAVEIGEGATWPAMRGSEAHDAIRVADPGATPRPAQLGGGYVRDTHRAGGIEGGMSTGGLIVARVAMKPLATLNRPDPRDGRRGHQGGDRLVQGADRRDGRAGHGRGGRDDGRPGAGLGGAAQVRRRLGGRVRA